MGKPEPPEPGEDQTLVKAVLAGQPGAFEQLVRAYQALCWHIVNRMVRHPADTQDLCQETFLRVYRHLHQYRFESPLRTWIGRIAYSVALRHLERKHIPVATAIDEYASEPFDELSDGFDLEATCADAEIVAALHAEIEALAPLQRTLLTLYHLDELSIAEIAGITNLAEGTIKSHLFRCRKLLRKRLQSRIGAFS